MYNVMIYIVYMYTFLCLKLMCSLLEGALLSEPLKLTKVFHMLNSGAAPMRIRYVGLGQGGMCDGNGFSVLNCGEEIVIQTNKSMKLELS